MFDINDSAPYFFHMELCDSIVDQIKQGKTSLNIPERLSDSDLQYIKNRVYKETGINITSFGMN